VGWRRADSTHKRSRRLYSIAPRKQTSSCCETLILKNETMQDFQPTPHTLPAFRMEEPT
jgi:hypothetical protein